MTDGEYRVTDRRPIRSRDTAWARAMATRLASAGASPNTISIVGMVAAIAAGAALSLTALASDFARLGWLLAALLIQCRLLCNLLDGMVAVERGVASPVGELFNEVPDRVSDAAVMIGLGYAAGGEVRLGFAAAIVALCVAYVRAAAKCAGAPNDFCGPFAKAHRMAVVTALAIYMAATPTSWRVAFGPGGTWGEAAAVCLVLIVGGLFTAGRRLLRAARALHRRAAVDGERSDAS